MGNLRNTGFPVLIPVFLVFSPIIGLRCSLMGASKILGKGSGSRGSFSYQVSRKTGTGVKAHLIKA